MLAEADLPDAPEVVRAMIVAASAETARLMAKVDHATAEIERINAEAEHNAIARAEANAEIAQLGSIVAAFMRHRFGPSSEKLDDDQFELVTRRWRAEIRFHRQGQRVEAPLRAGPGWYRGDLHSHSGHSDGSCANDGGVRVPCPVYRSVEAAARAGLDFLAVTDHNIVSHMTDLIGLQPAFSKLLLTPGQEVTTFFGHANVFGVTAPAEFRVGTPSLPDGAAWGAAMASLGGLVSVNHPGLPSGEAYMVCGWTMPKTDWGTVSAIEIANGGAMAIAGGRLDTPLSGILFWEKLLSAGHRVAPIAGSDNHDSALPPPRCTGDRDDCYRNMGRWAVDVRYS